MYGYVSNSDIAEARIELGNIASDSRLLKYLQICELESGGSILCLSSDAELKDEFEKRFGDFTSSLEACSNYHNALIAEIERLNTSN